MPELGWLPNLVECDWNEYEQTVDRAYAVFWLDFGSPETRPTFRGRRLGLKRYPEFEGKSATFWHLVTEGSVEAQRAPVRARIERIGWVRALIVEASAERPRVHAWEQVRPRGRRWVIALEDLSYVVVLDDRGDYLLPWTAFDVCEEHRRRKLRQERDAWLRAQKS